MLICRQCYNIAHVFSYREEWIRSRYVHLPKIVRYKISTKLHNNLNVFYLALLHGCVSFALIEKINHPIEKNDHGCFNYKVRAPVHQFL